MAGWMAGSEMERNFDFYSNGSFFLALPVCHNTLAGCWLIVSYYTYMAALVTKETGTTCLDCPSLMYLWGRADNKASNGEERMELLYYLPSLQYYEARDS